MNGSPRLIETTSTKPVSIALEEIAAGFVVYERVGGGIK